LGARDALDRFLSQDARAWGALVTRQKANSKEINTNLHRLADIEPLRCNCAVGSRS
jgi:hypothetical protein